MKLCALLLVIALINWYLSVPVPEAPHDVKSERPSGSYAGDALIFALCLLGVLYQKKREHDREE